MEAKTSTTSSSSHRPRSIDELAEALRQVEKIIVTDMTKIPPSLAVYMGAIREALIELIQTRAVMGDIAKLVAKSLII